MNKQFKKLIKEFQNQAHVCETVAKDKTEESLTGESRLKEKNEADARYWALKAEVWKEAELLVQKLVTSEEVIKPLVPNPLEAPSNLAPQ
jgi:hypothetical protein